MLSGSIPIGTYSIRCHVSAFSIGISDQISDQISDRISDQIRSGQIDTALALEEEEADRIGVIHRL